MKVSDLNSSKLKQWIDIQDEHGDVVDAIQLRIAKTKHAQNAVAIHLLYPDQNTIDNAVEDAIRDGFKVIVIHNQLTWPQAKGVKS